MHAISAHVQAAAYTARDHLRGLSSERGQGTVEYVGLILLVSLLMVGMVASLKGFNGARVVPCALLFSSSQHGSGDVRPYGNAPRATF